MLTSLTAAPIANQIAENNYLHSTNNLLRTSRPSLQESLSKAQIFGYNTQNTPDDRFMQTVAQYVPEFSNRSLQAIVDEPKQKPVEQYTAPVTSTANPSSEHEPLIPNPVITKNILPQFVSNDVLVISKSTLVVVISIVVAILLVEVWLRQKRIELMMLQQQQQRQQYQPQQTQQTLTYN